MDRKHFENALKLLRKNSAKRNFEQSLDLVINLKNLDIKKPENQVDIFVQLPKGTGKKQKICALAGREMEATAKENCDMVILHDNFAKYTGMKKELKQMSNQCSYFIAQANLMADVAKTFGKVLGTRGKMPNPTAGCVVPPNANLKPVIERLSKTIRVQAKKEMSAKAMVGIESMSDEDLIENITTVYGQFVGKLPNEYDNVKSVMLKFTMSRPVQIGKEVLE